MASCEQAGALIADRRKDASPSGLGEPELLELAVVERVRLGYLMDESARSLMSAEHVRQALTQRLRARWSS